MVHITDMKKTTLMEQVADDYEELGKQGRFPKKCIPRGYIPGLNWTTIHKDLDQPIKPVKQEEDPTEATTTQRLRDHQVVILDPKLSSNQPPYSRDNQNTILQQQIHWNAIQLTQRLMSCKLHPKAIP